MNNPMGRALAAYARTDLETRVEAASPEQLIVMLYEGAIGAMYAAKAAFNEAMVSANSGLPLARVAGLGCVGVIRSWSTPCGRNRQACARIHHCADRGWRASRTR